MATDTDNKDDEVVHPLNISDEEFLSGKYDFDSVEEDEVEEVADTVDEDVEQTSTDDDTETTDDESDESTEEDTSEEADADEVTKPDADEEESDEDSDEDDKSEDKDEDTKAEDDAGIDYKAEYEKFLAPFRANGREMSVKTVEEGRTLMSMGANYVKKMTIIKPQLKYIKMLDNNGLLSEDKISFLIDLDKKDPIAIQKLIKDSGIDPLDINVKDDTSYTKNTAHTVDDKEVELDGILEDIQDTESFQDTIDIIGKKWDSDSRNIIANEPEIIKVLNVQVASGVFKQITDVVERKRMLGELTGVSDIAAYKQVGDAMQVAGAFKPVPVVTETTTTSKTSVSEKKKADSSKLKSRKRAASSTKGSIASKQQDLNPLSMSDKDFEAMDEKLLNYN